MSNNSSAADAMAALNELEAMLGGRVEAVQHSAVELQEVEAAALANRFRALLKQAMRDDKVGVRALAKRLGVSPGVISRRLSSEGDLKVWTAAVLAHGLGRTFSVEMHKLRSASEPRPNRVYPMLAEETASSPGGEMPAHIQKATEARGAGPVKIESGRLLEFML